MNTYRKVKQFVKQQLNQLSRRTKALIFHSTAQIKALPHTLEDKLNANDGMYYMCAFQRTLNAN